MKMRLVLLVVGLLMAGVLVAACGDDEDSGGGGGETTAQEETGGGGETTTETTTEESGGGSATPQSKEAAEACKKQISANPAVSPDLKTELEELCEKAASGDAEEARQATKDVCLKIVDEVNKDLPDSAKEQAKAACDQATAAP